MLVLGHRQLGRRHRGRVLADRRRDLPGDAPRCLRPAQVPERQADRRGLDAAGLEAAAPGAALLHACACSDIAVGDMTDYGLPKPDHKLFEAHPTVSSELLPRLGHGDIAVKPNIDRFTGGPHRPLRRRQRGGDRPRRLLHRLQDRPSRSSTRAWSRRRTTGLPLYRRVASVAAPRPLLHRLHPAARADHAARRGAVGMGRRPARRARGATAGGGDAAGDRATKNEKMRKRFVASKRHTVEVDFHPYLREIRRERKQAAQRA